MSTKHGLDREGKVVCTASARDDGSNVTSSIDDVTCTDCRADLKWFINECGDVYDYWASTQEADFPADFHTAYETQDEAEAAAEHLDDPDPAAPLPQMSYEDAISYAIFAINTLEEPDASSDRDVERLYEYADQVKATLVDIRDTVRGLPAPPEPKWPAVTPT